MTVPSDTELRPREQPDVRVDGRVGHLAGLDGLRGVAVLAVVAFHLAPDRVPGGFLGVSMFFALSGYLITSLLLVEFARSGSVSLRAFAARRFRRLLPLSSLTLAAVAVGWVALGMWSERLRFEVWLSAASVANWGFALSGVGYGPDAMSPVLHFWSLSVEEQLYLLLPGVALLSLRRSRRVFVAVLVAVTVAGVVFALVVDSRAVGYYSTLSRSAELTVGALVAVVVPASRRFGVVATRAAAVVVVVVFAMLATAIVLLGLSDSVVYSGGLFVVAAAAALLAGLLPHVGCVARVVDAKPLAWCGKVSYALYLFHWPALVATRQMVAPPLVVPVVCVVSFTLAAVSYRFVEKPIRLSSTLKPAAAVVALSVATVAAVSVWAPPRPSVGDFKTDLPSLVASVPAPAAGVDQVRVAVVGDSKALALAAGFAAVASPTEPVRLVSAWAGLGCTALRGGSVRNFNGEQYETGDWCDWEMSLADAPSTSPADVVLVWFGTWDVRDRLLPGMSSWSTIAEQAVQDRLAVELGVLTDATKAATGAATVALLTLVPEPSAPYQDRFAVWNTGLERFAATRSDVVVVDVAASVVASGDAARLLPDGIHPSFAVDSATAPEIVSRFVAPALVELATHALPSGP